MKLKVKGLVFVGFAAAVFASSAMAVGENIVTSQHYVDNKFQTLTNIVTTTEAQTASNWDSEEIYPSMAVLKGVRDTVNAIDVTDDNNYVSVTEGTGNDVGTFTVALDGNKIDTTGTDIQASTTTNDGNLVTAGAVKAFAQDKRKIDAATGDGSVATPYATTIAASSANDTYPTSQNVYQFVTGAIGTAGQGYQRKLENTETGLYVGKYDNNDSTWKALENVAAGDQATTDYVTIKENNGVYQVNIPTAQIATTAALTGATATNDTGLVTAGSVRETILQAGNTAGGTIASAATAQSNNTSDETVPTTKNVYEFVTNYTAGQYQVQNDTAAPMVGYGNDWRQLSASGTTGASGNTYVVMETQTSGGVTSYKINLASDAITTTGAAIAAYTDQNNGDVNDLTTVKAVKEYVASQVDTQFALGTNPCATANGAQSGAYCALVAHYDSTAGGAVYEWTVIAEPVAQNP